MYLNIYLCFLIIFKYILFVHPVMSKLGVKISGVARSKVREAAPGTVLITIVRAKNIVSQEKKIVLELSNETNRQLNKSSVNSLNVNKIQGEIRDHSPGTVNWNERFYYNSIQMVDDNITFTLRQQNERDSYSPENYLGKVVCQNIGKLSEEGQRAGSSSQQKTLQLKNRNDQISAELQIVIEFIQQQDIIGGVVIPTLSLAPPPGFKARYNALDLYIPPKILAPGEDVKPSSKYNCFNFYDGDIIPSFDQIDIFAAKFQKANPRQKNKTDIFSVWSDDVE